MTVLLFGSSGLVGSAVLSLLKNYNITVICPTSKAFNFLRPNLNDLADYLAKVDVIINAVGVMSNNKDLMQTIHHHTPIMIAQFVKNYAIKNHQKIRWINISALGADECSDIDFLASKGHGDQAILSLQDNSNHYFDVHIIRPSLIYDKNGISTQFFLKLAKLPILCLPHGGHFLVQPVHNQDVALGIFALITNSCQTTNQPAVINFIGNKAMTLAEYLIQLRNNHYHKDNMIIISLPLFLSKMAMLIGRQFSHLITTDSLKLLEQDNIADNQAFVKLLNRQPLDASQFI